MNATDVYRHQLEMGRHQLTEMVKGFSQSDWLTAPVTNGNFPLWNVAHLAFSEARGLNVRIRGGENPLEHWTDMFGQGSKPVEGGPGYPSHEAIWDEFLTRRKDLLEFVATQSDTDLDQSTNIDHPMFNTVGKTLATLSFHQFFHIGQIADTRRKLGKEPVMA